MPWFIAYALIIALPLVGMYYYTIRQLLNAGDALWNWNRTIARRWFVCIASFANLMPVAVLVTFWIGGREAALAFSGESRIVDWVFTYPFWFSLVITIQLFILLILWHPLRALVRKFRPSWTGVVPKVTFGLAVFAVAYSCLRISLDTWTIRLNERDIKLTPEFSALDGVRIVQTADVQGDGRTTPEYVDELVEKANALKPDIVLFCGDVVTSGSKYVGSTIDVLARLRARYGKIAVVGDHDMFSGKQPIVDGLKSAGFTVPQDSSIRLEINGVPVVITGVVYTYRQRASDSTLEFATENGHPTSSDYKIFLVHQPRESLVQYASSAGYDLFAAGHTHGGQIAIGIPGVFLVPPSRFETKYFSGFYRVGKMLVSVNNGLGHTLAPIRFQAPAEITLIRLVK